MEEPPVLCIEAKKNNRLYLRDLWNYRELFAMLAWRDILVRYKQTVVGVAWSVIRPLLSMIVFTVVFGKIAGLPSDNVPYVLMVFAGMLPWQFFSNTLTTGSESLIGSQALISKVYFPRLIIPTSRIVISLIELAISALIFVPLFFWYRYVPSWQIVFLPFFVILVSAISLGITFIIAALNVKYRDFRYIVPFMVQFGMYVSPVGFSSAVIPEKWQLWYQLNPMVGVIDGIRWSLFNSPVSVQAVVISVIAAIVLMVAGFYIFRQMETEFADYI